MNLKAFFFCFLLLFPAVRVGFSQPVELASNNLVWKSQSRNSGESMPCGGGDIGLNVWVENGDLFFYISKSGSFDENNAMLKAGRVRIQCSPNPFEGGSFRQELVLHDGHVVINASANGIKFTGKIWVDVFRPVIHADIATSKPVTATVTYESWRYHDYISKGIENRTNSWKPFYKGEVTTYADSMRFENNAVLFYHQNRDYSIFDTTVAIEGLANIKDQLYNPLKQLVFGGSLRGKNMHAMDVVDGKYANTPFKGYRLQSNRAAKQHSIEVVLHNSDYASIDNWKKNLHAIEAEAISQQKVAYANTIAWWHKFWERSYIFIEPDAANENSEGWQVGRNYQLFRYMLGCNSRSDWPTKFNGGLFTYDPVFVDPNAKYTPDFRAWGGGTHTAQNQRLVYFPMIRSGDFDLMKPQFDFYLRLLKNAELRTKFYWGHGGASFTEQMENFGLPNPGEYGYKRPADYDKGMEYNRWLEYLWDTSLEFCLMMLEQERYTGADISSYLPFIESCLQFFDEHYQMLARQRGASALDGNGHLVLYPGSAAETYKMTYNSATTVAGLQVLLSRLLELPASYATPEKRTSWQAMLKRIPPLSFDEYNGHTMLAPAKLWERINNSEAPQLYPVYPWGIYGVGKTGLDTAINTFLYDSLVVKYRSHVGWRQHSIFAARLGLTHLADSLTTEKLKNSGRRFPAFWGPGFDWTPDHNWGGSGMIGLQEMLLQTDDKKIYLFPAWSKEKDVHFKLHAPYNTTVEAVLRDGKISMLKVMPEERRSDVEIMLK
jgi:hypothetical protein